MWTPPEKRKFSTGEVAWPSEAEARAGKWLSPGRIGALATRTRTWVPAMVPWRATDEGFVTPAVLAWYRRFAQGKPGVLVVEATGIRDVASGPLLRIGHDRYVDGLRSLVETVRESSGGETRLFIQLIDFLQIRRRPEAAKFFERFLKLETPHRVALGMETASDAEVRARLASLSRDDLERVLTKRELEALDHGARERVTDVHLPHIAELPRVLPGLFGDAAERARDAGFDGVELHYAHAYTMASFLSGTNMRDDGYGGTRAGRVRLPVEILQEVKSRVGNFVVGARLLADEVIANGSTVDDAAYFCVELARAGADFLSLSRGGKFDDAQQPKVGEAAYPYTGQSGYECMPTVISDDKGPFGRNIASTAICKRAVTFAGCATPIVVAGGIHSFAQAEEILQRGDADFVASARQSLADPDWFEKILAGRGAEVRRCLFTNYCEALDQRHVAVTCQRWDREGLDEAGVMLDPSGRRRLIPPEWKR